MSSASVISVDFLSGHPLPVTKNRHPISQREDFIEPVTYINDRRTAGAKIANDREEPLDVMLRQHRGRFVENEHARLQRERLGNFHALPVADREAAGSSSHIDIRGIQGLRAILHASVSARRQSKAKPPKVLGIWPEKMFSATLNSG